MPWSIILFILFRYWGKMSSFFLFFSKRPTKNNILLRSSLTQVSLFALWPPHLIPGGAGCFFGIPVAPDGCLSLLRKKGRSHYCRHFFLFFFLTVRRFFFSSWEIVILQSPLSPGAAFSPALSPVKRLNHLSIGKDHSCHFHVFFNPGISKLPCSCLKRWRIFFYVRKIRRSGPEI